jgi:homoserine dehydrogenase
VSHLSKSADQRPSLCVLKFGSSVLTCAADYARVVHEIYRHTRTGEKVIAIVSALAGETDDLFAMGKTSSSPAADKLVARLVRTGELKSAALMGLALEQVGVPVVVLDPHEMELKAEGDALNADLVGLNPDRIWAHLESADVIVVPGFTGDSQNGPVTLGRGGTDLTAIMFSHWLGASRARLIKDVDGVYTDDPQRAPDAERLDCLDYADAAQVSRGLVQEKAIAAARDLGVIIEVAALGKTYATRIGPQSRVTGPVLEARRLRVCVLGHGAVGAGVCRHLLAHPNRFCVNPVLVRDQVKHEQNGPNGLVFTDSPDIALAQAPDIVVETMGGTALAAELSERALRIGSHLVTANKAIIARSLEQLNDLAVSHQCKLQYSAAVGASVPVLERIDGLARSSNILRVDGVMNGTCNYIFGQLENGASLESAISAAQAAGFAEADPSTDLDGHDAADKLAIIAWHAFGVRIEAASIPKQSLFDLTADEIQDARSNGRVFKQIGSCTTSHDGLVTASVKILAVSKDHIFAGLRDAENGFVITHPQGEILIDGKGAGSWPTAEAVFADIMDVQRHVAAAPSPSVVNLSRDDYPHLGRSPV